MKNRKYIYTGLLLFVFILASLFLVNQFSSDDSVRQRDLEEITKDGVLRIVTDYSPIGYYVSGDTIAGFNHDLIQLIQSYTSLKIEISLESSLEQSISGLETNKYDVIARSIPVTTDLRNTLAFTEPILQNKQVLVQRKSEYNDGKKPIRSHLDLAQKTLYVAKSSPAILRIKNLAHEIGDTIYVKEDDVYEAEQLAMMVASMEIDYAVCDEQVAKRLSSQMPELDYATFIGFTHLEAWAIRQDSPILLDSLNNWIDKAKKGAVYDHIYEKYINKNKLN